MKGGVKGRKGRKERTGEREGGWEGGTVQIGTDDKCRTDLSSDENLVKLTEKLGGKN